MGGEGGGVGRGLFEGERDGSLISPVSLFAVSFYFLSLSLVAFSSVLSLFSFLSLLFSLALFSLSLSLFSLSRSLSLFSSPLSSSLKTSQLKCLKLTNKFIVSCITRWVPFLSSVFSVMVMLLISNPKLRA